MASPKYQYYLRYDDAGTWKYYTVTAGVVGTTTTATPIQFAPKNWENAKREWERGFTYYGIFTKFTGQLEFVKDGAQILRHVYYTYGVEGECQLLIKRFDNSLAVFDYVDDYTGDCDFTRMVDRVNFFAIEITQAGFVSKLTAREDTPYTYDIRNNAEKVWVKMHGIPLQYRCKWTGVYNEDIDTYGTHSIVSEEGTLLKLTISDETFNTPPVNISANWGLLAANKTAASIDVEFVYDYSYEIFVPNPIFGDPVKWRLYYNIVTLGGLGTLPSASTSVIYDSGYFSPAALGTTATYSGTNTQTITLAPDQGVRIEMGLLGSSGPYSYDADYTCTQKGSTLQLFLGNATPVGYIPGLRIGTVGNYLMQSISDSDVNDSSTLLNVTHYDKVLVSGDSVRNLPNSLIKLSFKDLFNFVNDFQGCALMYTESTNIAALELKSRAYDANSIGDLGEVTDLEVMPWTDEMFTTLRVGYRKQTYDEVNGKDEFNDEVTFLSPCVRAKGTKEYISSIRTDMYGVELHRLNLTGKELTDADSDNDIWCLHVETVSAGTVPAGEDGAGEDYFELFRTTIDETGAGVNANYWSIQNIYSPETAFNITFSPKRCIERNAAWYAALLHNLDAESLVFQSGNKTNSDNQKMVTIEGVALDTVDEQLNIPISDLGTPMFYPVKFKCRIINPIDIDTIIAANPYGYFDFTWDGNTYKGHVIRAVDNGGQYQGQEIEMMATNTNNLLNLIG